MDVQPERRRPIPPELFADDPPALPDNPVADAMAAWSDDARRTKSVPKSRTRGVSNVQWDKAVDETAAMMTSGEWDGAKPLHFVTLFAGLHAKVYGFPPDMNQDQRRMATFSATAMLRTHFDGNSARIADYLRWVWTREQGREKWRKENGRDGGALRWQLVFSNALLADYRLHLARTNAL